MRDRSRSSSALHRAFVFAAFTLLTSTLSIAAAEKRRFDIAAGDAPRTLNEFSRQAELQIYFDVDVVRRFITHAVAGEFEAADALSLMLEGTGLAFEFVNPRTIAVRAVRPAAFLARPIDNRSAESVQPDSGKYGSRARGGAFRSQALPQDTTQSHNEMVREAREKAYEEVVVTGTHIRGGTQPSSPVTIYTREDMEKTGYTSVAAFMESIPQNFGGVSGDAGGSGLRGNTQAGNGGFGTAVDLRGLGADSTLILVNGRRLAPGGQFGAFIDVSVIPLSAIERIEILADGASAIYGSDGIGGVVNYILRDDFQGAETSLQYGSVTDGGRREYRATQSLGTNWSAGSAFISYELSQQDNLLAAERSFSVGATPGDLTPRTRQNSAFLSASHEVNDLWMLRGDAFYSDRTADFVVISGTPAPTGAGTKQFAAALESQIALPRTWVANLGLTYGGHETSATNRFGTSGGDSRLLTVDLHMDGPIGRLWGGDLRAAVGAQFREEGFDKELTGSFANSGPEISEERTARAGFAEIDIPIVSQSNRRTGIESLDLVLAGRYERYSDFGSSFDPKAGIAWVPVAGLRVRGTVSSSFKAPSFQQQKGLGRVAVLANSLDPLSSTGRGVALLLLGDNQLDPQTSSQWTAGFDVFPARMSRFQARVTYYDIQFEDRIASPGVPGTAPLSQPNTFGSFTTRNPSSAEVNAFASAATTFANLTTIPALGPPRQLSDVTAIVDGRVQNLAATDVSGIDLSISLRNEASRFGYEIGLSGAYLLDFENQPRPNAVPVSDLNILGRPVDLRLRGMGTISRGGASATAAVNYVDDYWDRTRTTPVPIASWITVDLQLRYRAADSESWWATGTELALSCLNLLDKNPPSVSSPTLFEPVGYDAANASALGRTLTLRVKKQW